MSEEQATAPVAEQSTEQANSPEVLEAIRGGSEPSIVNETGEFKQGWTSSFPELEGINLDKFKSVDALAKSYAHLERQKNASYYPQEDWNEDKIQSYREVAGVPETPSDYRIKPEVLPEGVQWDDEYAGKIAELAHKHHIPAKAVQDLVAADLERQQATATDFEKHIENQRKEAEDSLRQEWGMRYDKEVEKAGKALGNLAKESNLSEEEFAQVKTNYGNDPVFIKMMSKLSSQFSEAKIHGTRDSIAEGYKTADEQLSELYASGKVGIDPAVTRKVDELTKEIANQRSTVS